MHSCKSNLLFTCMLFYGAVGFVIICIGGLLESDVYKFTQFWKGHWAYFGPPMLLVYAGFGIFCVSMIGYFAWQSHSPRTLTWYAVIIFLLLVKEILITLIILRTNNSFLVHLKSTMWETARNVTTRNPMPAAAWDAIQTKKECCGVRGEFDWVNLKLETPISCCREEVVDCRKTGRGLYQIGCFDILAQEMENYLVVSGLIGLPSILLQIASVILASMIAGQHRRYRNSYSNSVHAAEHNYANYATHLFEPAPNAPYVNYM